MTIHATAQVSPAARLGKDVSVGPFAVIGENVTIGDGSDIGPHVAVFPYTTIGARCRIHAGAVLGDLPQDLSFKEVPSYVRIGDECVIREGVTIHRGTKAETVTEIGDGCYLMAFSHFAHNVRLGRSVIVANGALLAGYVDVGDRVFISGNCVVHQFVRIGRLAMLGGASGISKDVPPFCTTRPAEVNRLVGLNVVGMRRAGMNPEERLEVKRAFTLLYRSGLNFREAAQRIREQTTSPMAVELADFVGASKRGICAMRAEAVPTEDEG